MTRGPKKGRESENDNPYKGRKNMWNIQTKILHTYKNNDVNLCGNLKILNSKGWQLRKGRRNYTKTDEYLKNGKSQDNKIVNSN